MGKLGVFCAGGASVCLGPHLGWGGVGPPLDTFEPSGKIFLLTIPRRYFFCGSFVLFMSCVCHLFQSVYCCLLVA